MRRLIILGILCMSVLPMGCWGAVTSASGTANARAAKPMKPTLLEFYYLKDVRNRRNPTGKWRMSAPMPGEGSGYVFTAPDGKTINSLTQPKEVLDKVVNARHNPPILTNEDLKPTAKADLLSGNRTGLSIEFNERGRKVFRDFTRFHIDEYLAVFSNGRLLTAPLIKTSIPNGRAEITGLKTIAEAKDLADRINAAASPAKPNSPQAGQPTQHK